MASLEPLLCLAIGLSLQGFLSTFSSTPNMSRKHLALVTASTSIFLTAVGISFVDRMLVTGGLLVACGLAIGFAVSAYITLPWSLLVSASSFAIYLHGVPD